MKSDCSWTGTPNMCPCCQLRTVHCVQLIHPAGRQQTKRSRPFLSRVNSMMLNILAQLRHPQLAVYVCVSVTPITPSFMTERQACREAGFSTVTLIIHSSSRVPNKPYQILKLWECLASVISYRRGFGFTYRLIWLWRHLELYEIPQSQIQQNSLKTYFFRQWNLQNPQQIKPWS